jgi:hypothetical protein
MIPARPLRTFSAPPVTPLADTDYALARQEVVGWLKGCAAGEIDKFPEKVRVTRDRDARGRGEGQRFLARHYAQMDEELSVKAKPGRKNLMQISPGAFQYLDERRNYWNGVKRQAKQMASQGRLPQGPWERLEKRIRELLNLYNQVKLSTRAPAEVPVAEAIYTMRVRAFVTATMWLSHTAVGRITAWDPMTGKGTLVSKDVHFKFERRNMLTLDQIESALTSGRVQPSGDGERPEIRVGCSVRLNPEYGDIVPVNLCSRGRHHIPFSRGQR